MSKDKKMQYEFLNISLNQKGKLPHLEEHHQRIKPLRFLYLLKVVLNPQTYYL